MKDELAERVLANVMAWNAAQVAEVGGALQQLAGLKYDEYEGYRPGVKFLESLAAWLWQMEPPERELAVEFVLKHLVFISRAELEHLIETVYPDVIRPLLVERAASLLGAAPHRVKAVTESPEFRELQRKTLILGLADGARLDRLRRASPELSHEQFWLVPELGEQVGRSMADQLQKALTAMNVPGPALFLNILLVDDFTGSGATLLRPDGPSWKGKLWKTHLQIESLKDAIAADAQVTILLYIASEQAQQRLQERLKDAGLPWEIRVVQRLRASLSVTDARLVDICNRYFDPILQDQHLLVGGQSAALGFGGVSLPLVIHHNTPNNSIAILWADTSDRLDSARRRALFPRRERHQSDRP
mgnify:CR=1 FL=1